MTDKYAVVGNPIAHSKSPLIHRMFAEQTSQDVSYEAIFAPLDGFKKIIERLRLEGYKGCNVTVPFKFEAFRLANQLSERAQTAQAVNTLRLDGEIISGDNTDGAGLVRDIEVNLNFLLSSRRVLLLGAGGAAYGVVLPLLGAGANIIAVNRTPEKAQQLGEAFNGRIAVCTYHELDGKSFDCIINATSTGLTNDEIPLPAGIFAPGALAYDMMYGRETPFMKFSRKHGAMVSDGLGMLVEQAAEAFFIWRGVRPETAPVISKLHDFK